jgi:monoamine oxidase
MRAEAGAPARDGGGRRLHGRRAGRIDKAGAKGNDVAFSDFIEDRATRWNMLVRQVIGQITSHDPEDCSTLDSARYEDEGGDFPVEDGFGALVARMRQAWK